jgi:hypothetical protein
MASKPEPPNFPPWRWMLYIQREAGTSQEHAWRHDISSPIRHEMAVFAKIHNDINGVLPQESHIPYNICLT